MWQALKRSLQRRIVGRVATQSMIEQEMERNTSLQITRSLQTSCLTHLNPWFITGFADAEASFSIPFQRVKNNKIGFKIHATFQIGLHKGDRPVIRND